MSGVTLNENGVTSPSTTEFRRKLEASPLRFAFQDGKIENVCSESGEDERVLNVKRGVLSTFQNSMDQLEKDGLFTEVTIYLYWYLSIFYNYIVPAFHSKYRPNLNLSEMLLNL